MMIAIAVSALCFAWFVWWLALACVVPFLILAFYESTGLIDLTARIGWARNIDDPNPPPVVIKLRPGGASIRIP